MILPPESVELTSLTGAGVRLRRPSICGGLVAFIANDQAWLGALDGSGFRPIPTPPGRIINVFLSPDRTEVAVTIQDGEVREVYRVDLETHESQRLTFDLTGATCLGWNGESGQVLFRSAREHPHRRNRIYQVPRAGGYPVRLPMPEAEFITVDSDGRIVYVPASVEDQARNAYRGGKIETLWLADRDGRRFQPLTRGTSADTTPVWAAGRIYFASDRDGESKLYSLNPDAPEEGAVPVAVDLPGPLRYPQSDGVTLVFECGDDLAALDLQTSGGTPRSARLLPYQIPLTETRIFSSQPVEALLVDNVPGSILRRHAVSEDGSRGILEARGQLLEWDIPAQRLVSRIGSLGARHSFPALSTTGRLAFLSDAEVEGTRGLRLWICEPGGDPRPLTQELRYAPERPRWSPDGKWIALGDHAGRITLVNTTTGVVRIIAQSEISGQGTDLNDTYCFSPDSRMLAYVLPSRLGRDVIWLYLVDAGCSLPVTLPEIDCYSPAFSPDSKQLYFLLDRDFASRQNALNGMEFLVTKTSLGSVPLPDSKRLLELSSQAGDFLTSRAGQQASSVLLSHLSILLKGQTVERVATTSDYLLVQVGGVEPELRGYVVQPAGGELRLAWSLEKVTEFELSTGGHSAFAMTSSGLTGLRLGDPPSQTPLRISNTTVRVDPPSEWSQILHEVWRWVRDFFWNPQLAESTEWAHTLERYEARLSRVASRGELNSLIEEMLAELKASHVEVNGGLDVSTSAADGIGYLGADLEPVAGKPAWRITRILRHDPYRPEFRSPLLGAEGEVQEGEYLRFIGNTEVRSDLDLNSLLLGTAGRPVELRVSRDPDDPSPRPVTVTPTGSDERLRKADFAWRCRERVWARLGTGVGYLRLEDMGKNGLSTFCRLYQANLDSRALIIDVRNNSGGSVSDTLLLHLQSRAASFIKPRHGRAYPRGNYFFTGQVVVLCNEATISNGEEFCHGIQQLGLGLLIGRRTEGSCINGEMPPLIDGGRINIPSFGVFSPHGSGWIAEGRGIVPDLEVAMAPAEELHRDVILDAAIDYLSGLVQSPAYP